MWQRMFLAALPLLAAAGGPARAADPASAKAVAPFVDAQTVAVARLDVTRFDPAALADHLAKAVPGAGDELADMRKGLSAAKEAFTRAGGRDVYLVLSLADPQAPALGVIPLHQGADAAALLKLAADPKFGGAAEKVGAAVVVGTKRAVLRATTIRPADRPELARALEAAGDGVAQLALIPSDDHRRVVEELSPTLPEEVGGGPVKALTRGLMWAAVGLGEKPALRLTVQSADAESARAFVALMRKGLELLGRQKFPGEERTIREGGPDQFDAVVKLLTPEPKGDRLVVSLDRPPEAVTGWLARAVNTVRAAAGRAQSSNNLKQIGLALHNHHDAVGRLPGQAICDKDGKPLLSWRVAILPYIEQDALYREFKLDEPWDSEHNKKLIARMPKTYAAPGQAAKLTAEGKTAYLVPVGKGLIFTGEPKGSRLVDIPDGTSNTIMAVEANDASAVTWTKPDDLTVNQQDPLKGLLGHNPTGFQALFGDGSVRFIAKTVKPMTLWAMFTASGGEVIADDQ